MTPVLLAAFLLAPQSPPAKPKTPPCTAVEHRQFDFWIGEWDVTLPNGKPAGQNRITSILGGCVLHESWKSARGANEGESFNIYGPDGRWHQTWVDNGGTLLNLAGGVRDGAMVMSEETRDREGRLTLNEIRWEKLPSGQVRQHWRTSTDGGATWSDAFVGIYTRMK